MCLSNGSVQLGIFTFLMFISSHFLLIYFILEYHNNLEMLLLLLLQMEESSSLSQFHISLRRKDNKNYNNNNKNDDSLWETERNFSHPESGRVNVVIVIFAVVVVVVWRIIYFIASSLLKLSNFASIPLFLLHSSSDYRFNNLLNLSKRQRLFVGQFSLLLFGRRL